MRGRSGAAPSAGTHHPVRAGNLRTYKPLEQQNVPEIVQTLEAAGARDVALRFVPVSAPLARGIFATAFVELPEAWTQDRLEVLYREAYAGEPFVRVPRRRLPEVAAVSGSNFAEVGVAAGPARGGARTVTVFGAADNLVKGGAGQAVENMNLMLGLDEKASSAGRGPWPPWRPAPSARAARSLAEPGSGAVAATVAALVSPPSTGRNLCSSQRKM